jgi:hypothetical protein
MTNSARVGGVFVLLVLCYFVWGASALDCGEALACGTYHLAQNGETSTLILKPDHGFQQDFSKSRKVQHAEGTWRLVGEGGLAFSKEFITVSGQEPGADGTAYVHIQKRFGLFVTLVLSDHDVLWYGRVDPSSDNTVSGT